MLLIRPTIIEPISAPVTVPIPPRKLVPPTITAVIASNSYPSPTDGIPAISLAISTTPASPVSAPLSVKIRRFVLFVLIPDAIVACSFQPIA